MFSLSSGLGSFGALPPIGIVYGGKSYESLDAFFLDSDNKNIFAAFANATFMFKQNFNEARTKEQREVAVDAYLISLGLKDQKAIAALNIKYSELGPKLKDKNIPDATKVLLITGLIASVTLSSLCLERLFVTTKTLDKFLKTKPVLGVIDRLSKFAIAGVIVVNKEVFAAFSKEMTEAKDEQQMNKAFENLLKGLNLPNTNDTKKYWDGTIPELQEAVNNALMGQKPDVDQKDFLANLYALIAFLFGYTGLEWAKTTTSNSVVKKLFGILKGSAIQQRLDELAGPQPPVETKGPGNPLLTGIVLASIGALGAYAFFSSKKEKKSEDEI